MRWLLLLFFALTACVAPSSSRPGGGDPCDAPCGGSCCQESEICVAGSECLAACSDSSECGASTPCCGTFNDGTSACVPDDGRTVCRCQSGAQCASGSCSPGTALSNPFGLLVCTPDDGALYDGCNATGACVSPGDCCVLDGAQNHFCAPMGCTADAECGADFHCYGAICGGRSVCAP
jgi:hypothetical protein